MSLMGVTGGQSSRDRIGIEFHSDDVWGACESDGGTESCCGGGVA